MKKNKINNILTNKKPRVIFDMDDVIVYYVDAVIEDYNKKYNTHYTVEDCTKWELHDLFGDEIRPLLFKKGRYENLKEKKNAVKYIKEIIDTERYDVFIVTACNYESAPEKFRWIHKHMPFFKDDRIIITGEKSCVWGHVLIDDKIDNIDEFVSVNTGSIGIVYDMPHNRYDNKYKRLNSLESLLNYLDSVFYENNLTVVNE